MTSFIITTILTIVLLIILVKTLTELYYILDSTRIEKELNKRRSTDRTTKL